MNKTTRSDHRTPVTCSCGNEFTVPPNKRGSWVYCLECNEEVLALEPDDRAHMEEQRRPAMERHVRAIAFWLAVGGLLFGISGFTHIVSHTSPEYLPPSGLGYVVEGLLVMALGGGLVYFALQVQQHRSWTWPVLRYGAGLVVPVLAAGLYLRLVPLQFPVPVTLVYAVLVGYVLYRADSRELFTSAYREIVNTLRGNILSILKSVVFWGPLLTMVGFLLLIG